MELLHNCDEIKSQMFTEHLHHIFSYWTFNGINTQQLSIT